MVLFFKNTVMIFSKYNFLFESKKHGYFLYNSLTNSFLKLNSDLYELLYEIKSNPASIADLDEEVKKTLIKAKNLVEQHDDDSFFIQKNYLAYFNSFSAKGMGVIIVPTMACNFACPYCYEENLPTNKMSEEVQNKIIKFIESHNNTSEKIPIHLCWHGGEPLLAFDVIQSLLEKIKKSNKINIVSHDLVSNGYLLDLEKCKILKKYNLNGIQITIDGLAEEHNKSRIHKSGLPTYDKIIENVDYLTQYMPECSVTIRVNVHNNNKNDFHKLYSNLTERWKGRNCSINMKYVTENEHCKVKCLAHKERINFISDLYKEHGLKNINFFPENQEYGCTATSQNSFIFGTFGELYKCWADVGRKDRIIGNLDDAITNLPLLSEYMIDANMFNDPKCKNCVIMPICAGGCNLQRYENKHFDKKINVCPIDISDLPNLLELHYEQQIEKKV